MRVLFAQKHKETQEFLSNFKLILWHELKQEDYDWNYCQYLHYRGRNARWSSTPQGH